MSSLIRRSAVPASTLLALVALAVPSAGARGQTMRDLLRAVRQGGGWIGIPIEEGRGALSTTVVPTGGLVFTGCLRVYAGHTGRWQIRARDTLGDGRLDAWVKGGEPVRFTYDSGLRAQLEVDARWSEARDTTLLVWVGLETPSHPERDACEPVYGGGQARPLAAQRPT
jgi:hypothetical protein